jgi:Tol biopolymer transport system component
MLQPLRDPGCRELLSPERNEEVMTRVNHFRMLALAAATLVAALLALAAGPAEAAFPGDNGLIAFASNRSILAGDPSSTDTEIFTMDPSNPIVTLTQLTKNDASDSQPAWSPDGSRISFVSNRDGNPEIYMMDPNGALQTRLTNNAAVDSVPAFSPGGDRISFERSQGDIEIYEMDAADTNADFNGDDQTQLTNNSDNDSDPNYSPDGRKIAFGSGDFDIYTMKPVDSDNDGNGDGRTQITMGARQDNWPNYSPGGARIVFTRYSDSVGFYQVFVMNSDGSDQKKLSKKPVGDDWNPAFSPDGTRIAFNRDVPNQTEIFVMNSDGSNRTNRTNNLADDSDPDWQPVCTVKGTPDNDPGLDGSPGKDVICGFGGNDTIDAEGGIDVVVGAAGNDTIKGGSGRDRVFGGFGNDTLNVKDGVRRNDVVDGGEGTDTCTRDRGDKQAGCE